MIHYLKCVQPFYNDMLNSRKSFEVRKDDRGYEVGDEVWLYEYDPVMKHPCRAPRRKPENYLTFRIVYILRNAEKYGLMPGYCVLSVSRVHYVKE